MFDNKILFLNEKEKTDVFDPVILFDNVDESKPRINQCSVLYQAYKNVGKQQFVSKYKHVTFINTCVLLYQDPIWKYQGDDRIEKLSEKFTLLDKKIREEKPKLSYEPSVSITSKTDIGQGKFLVKFIVRAGDKSIDKAKVLVQSKIEAIQVGSNKQIPANSCRNYETQIHANNVANIQMSILEQVYTK
ncbi:MAG: plastocyanin [Nitrosopumilus sp.]|nr:plastocyanin [Nitrosopumilus sp.]